MKICTKKKFLTNLIKSIGLFSIVIFFVFFQSETSIDREEVSPEPARPWYFHGGVIRPRYEEGSVRLWPNEDKGDRIVAQLMYAPPVEPTIDKKVYVKTLQKATVPIGRRVFSECPVNRCRIVSNETVADAVIFEDYVTTTRKRDSSHQVWILHSLESPYYSGRVIQPTSVNWTATYRLDSDLVTPYGKWAYYEEGKHSATPERNYAAGKTKKVAWMVSNCHSKNKRLQYAKALARYINVDVYGVCGEKICLKDLDEYCREMISTNYKFYLSFENANCRDYITEKFFQNGLRLDVIPIVMGAPKEDYVKVAPQKSFIHVEDFPSPKALAEYLHFLDKNDDEYNSYFRWKGSGEFIDTSFMCRLCAVLHSNRPNHHYKEISRWWKNKDTCTKTFWNKTTEDEIVNFLRNFRKPSKWF